ncbi:MAG: carbohydrate kinase family protein [Solirubrobacteraceae bacterium]
MRDAATVGPQVVVAGHVCLDVIPMLQRPAPIEPGMLIEVGAAAVSSGGAVANTGVALHRLGVPVRLMGKVGDDLFGSALLAALDAHGLAAGMIVAPGQTTSYSIVISPPGVDRCFLHCPGTNDTFAADDVPAGGLAGARLFHFGYPPLMRRMYADDGRELRVLCRSARDAGLATSLDLCRPDPSSAAGKVDWRAILANTLAYVDVVGPSVEELLFMLDRPAYERLQAGEPVLHRAMLADLAGQLLDMGATVAAIKLGDQGLYLRTAVDVDRFTGLLGLDPAQWSDREVLSPCFAPRRLAGTTGSGDCTIAGLLAALLRGDGPAQAATAATAVGACCVEAADASSGIPPWPVVADRLRAGWARLPSAIGAHPR